jgi:hypothetical protein
MACRNIVRISQSRPVSSCQGTDSGTCTGFFGQLTGVLQHAVDQRLFPCVRVDHRAKGRLFVGIGGGLASGSGKQLGKIFEHCRAAIYVVPQQFPDRADALEPVLLWLGLGRKSLPGATRAGFDQPSTALESLRLIMQDVMHVPRFTTT